MRTRISIDFFSFVVDGLAGVSARVSAPAVTFVGVGVGVVGVSSHVVL